MTRTEHRASIVLDLFENSYHRVYCFCRRSLAPDMAEDIAQDVFARLLQIDRLPEMQISISYLIKIADNLIKRRYNRNQRFQRFLEANEGRTEDASGDSWAGLTPRISATRSTPGSTCCPTRSGMPSNWSSATALAIRKRPTAWASRSRP